MSRRVTLAVLLAGMTVSAIIIIITISNSINNQRIRAEQMAESAITETQPVAIGYYLKEYNGRACSFQRKQRYAVQNAWSQYKCYDRL